MCSEECFHFTYLNRAFSIREKGLVSRLEENSRVVKDSSLKISFSDGRYAAAGLMANFYKVYTDIKTGKRDKSKTDPNLARKVMKSKSFEEVLGNGMYLIFDGTDIENTGGNNGHINPFDAGTRESIKPEQLKVCMLRDEQTGELSYSKYDFALYLMMNLTADDYSKMSNNRIEDIEFYKKEHAEEMKKFEESKYSIVYMTMDEFCNMYSREIIEDLRKQYENTAKDNKSMELTEHNKTISMQEVVLNAITQDLERGEIPASDRERS